MVNTGRLPFFRAGGFFTFEAKMKHYGTLYGVGVGPGDPELLTLKALRVLREVDHIFAARSSKNTYSTAMSILRPHLGEEVEIESLPFPMTKDATELQQAWRENVGRILEVLEHGRSAAFLTLGDPMTYSTFGYVMQTLHDLSPDARVEVVPGVTSYQASAARARTVLVEREQTLAVVSGAEGGEKIAAVASAVDTLVVLKAYKQFPRIQQTLDNHGLLDNAVLISDCGKETEVVHTDVRSIKDNPGYFTLVLAKK